MDRVDDHAVPTREPCRPPEDRDLDPMRDEPEIEPERTQKRSRPCARYEHDHGRVHTPPGGLDPDDPPALRQELCHFAAGLDGRAQTAGGLGEGECRRVGIGEPRIGLPSGSADVVDPAPRQELGQSVRGHDLGLDAEALLPGDVSAELGLEAPGDDLEKADRLEAAIAAHDVPEITKNLEALERQLRFRLVGVVHPHQRAGFARGACAEVVALEQEDVLNSARCKVKSGTGAIHPTPDYDHVCPRHERSALLPSVGDRLD